MYLLLAVAVLPAAVPPLTVRVLARERPVRAAVTAQGLRCDGRQLRATAMLEVGAREVRVGSELCAEVITAGETSIKTGDLERTYGGTIRIALEGGYLRFINEIDVEEYLPAVVAAEMSNGKGKPAALEAQAIVSRTFAVTGRQRHETAGHHLCDLAHCQVYRGRAEETPESRAAVANTEGQVLLVGGVVLKPAFFHAACGGHTSRASDVFREDAAGPSVSDVDKGAAACAQAPDFAWQWSIDRLELARGLGLNEKSDAAAFEALRRDSAGRVLELRSFGKRFTGTEFHTAVGRAFGWQALRSLKATAKEADQTVTFTGTGVGHGVGLCQHGALALATRGLDATAILRRYFPDAQARRP